MFFKNGGKWGGTGWELSEYGERWNSLPAQFFCKSKTAQKKS